MVCDDLSVDFELDQHWSNIANFAPELRRIFLTRFPHQAFSEIDLPCAGNAPEMRWICAGLFAGYQ